MKEYVVEGLLILLVIAIGLVFSLNMNTIVTNFFGNITTNMSTFFS